MAGEGNGGSGSSCFCSHNLSLIYKLFNIFPSAGPCLAEISFVRIRPTVLSTNSLKS